MDRSLLHRHLPQVPEPGSGPAGPSTSQFTSLEVKPEDRIDNEGSTTTTASDFVKKLYKILEDRSDQEIISWGPKGDCFVVKDVTEFAKSLLPRMFKHSNFASFVRQLNKYDFHKVKTMDDDEGEETWTFRHPKFRAGGRDALESIKRKAPGRRKSNGSALPPMVSQTGSGSGANDSSHTDSETSRLATMQAELASLGSAHEEVLSHVRNLEKNYREVFLQMLGFQRTIAQQDGLMQNLMQYFSQRDPVGEIAQGQSSNGNTPGIEWGADNPFLFMQSPETQRLLDKSFAGPDVAQATLSQISDIARRAGAGRSPVMANDGASSGVSRSTRRGSTDPMRPVDMMAQIQEVQAQRERLLLNTPPLPLAGLVPSPSTSATNTTSPESGDAGEEIVVPTPSTSELGLGGSDAWGIDTAQTGLEVYTVGHLMPRDNNNSSSYTDVQGNQQWGYGGAFAREAGGSQDPSPYSGGSSGTGGGGSPETSTSTSTLRVRRAAFVPGWAVPPRVLLVDDDAVSRMLSSKFLQVFGCAIDVAVDGVSAVNKMNLEKYDLVLMDIVMPKLDGVSATSMIRKFDPRTPIISMTGNARPSDIMSYYSSGMNDVLSKPFSKQGLFDMLEKHLTHLTVMNEQRSLMRNVPPPLGLPPLNNAGFDNALQRGATSWLETSDSNNNSPDEDQRMNLLAGMGVSDEQYNFMLSDMLTADGFDFSTKRARDGVEGDLNGPDSKRSRFQEF
ncbi:hypothetical protein C8R47DRAFT_1165682 [Mycena vitilis]|nr:hypothetical protein C8R47DRAFT_1165682 [Mycena vitilis]